MTACYTINKEKKDPNNKCESDKTKWSVTCDFHFNGYRLPTEAEWEFAARGGNKSKGYKYSSSDNLSEVGWYGADTKSGNRTIEEGTSEVGKKQPNELGIYDMSGNVYEWCWDWYGDYSSGSQTNPKGANSGFACVLRGGSWFNDAKGCHVAVSGIIDPVFSDSRGGFRLARTR